MGKEQGTTVGPKASPQQLFGKKLRIELQLVMTRVQSEMHCHLREF